MKIDQVQRILCLGGFLFFTLFLPSLTWAQFDGIVISEINSNNQVELTNTSDQTIDIGSLWLCDFPAYQTVASSTLSLDCGNTNLAPGEVLVVTDWEVDPADGELGLYTSTQFSNPNAIIDYVEWGSANHTRSSIADAAGIWNQGDFLAAFANGQSLLYDGTSDAPSAWSTGNPSICTNNIPGPCTANGGTLTGGPFAFTVGDGIADMIPEGAITVANSQGENFQWIVTDDEGYILGLPPTFSAVNFDGAGPGTCLVWYLRYDGEITGLAAGLNANDLEGCFDLSNAVEVIRTAEGDCQANGGELFGGPFEFTVGDGIADMIPEGAITVANSQGENFQWIVTDDEGYILGLPPTFSAVNFDGAGPGTCLVWYLRYDGEITGLAAGLNANDLEGCFDLSNAVQVIRTAEGDCQANGGELFGGPFEFTVGDGIADMIPEGAITVANSQGENFQWIVTDDEGYILGLPPTFSAVNFDGAGPGTCLVWYLRYDGEITGLAAGLNANDLEGCFDLSNAVEVIRTAEGDCQANGGELFGGPFEFTVGDGIADMIPEGAITVANSQGENFQWIVTDDEGYILGLPPTFSAVNFDGAGPGTCLVWYLRYDGEITGLAAGLNANDLEGCFDLSNAVEVIRTAEGDCQANGGELFGGPFEFTVGDGIADMIPEGAITVANSQGENFQWIVTDDLGNILGLPPTFSAVDFDGAGVGLCQVWYLRYDGEITGLEAGQNIDNLDGCFGLSNPVDVNRIEAVDCDVEGGTLEGGPFAFCVGDGEADMIPEGSITLSGNSGMNSGWIVTDDQGNILGLPPMPSVVDFDGAGPGICLIWHLSYDDGLTGLEAGANTNDLDGCFSLSNSIAVTRYQPEGGTLEGGPFEFCVGDGEADMIPAGSITLSGNSGTNSAWLVTDDQGNILGLPPMPSVVDFDGAGPGICLIWHLSYEDGLTGLEVGANASDLDGCFSLSNSISITRNQPEGGTLEGGPFTFIVGDGVADMIAEGDITLTGNSGENSAWIVTDDLGNILGLPPTPSAVDFDDVEPGVCLIWHISYYGDLPALEVGNNASDLEGCFSLSNSIIVNREIVDATEEANPTTVQLQMWPNPVQSLLNVRTTFETRPEFVQYEVRTQLGQIVLQSQTGGQMLLRESLDVSQLPAGVYLLSVRTDETINTQTFVKQ